MNSANAMSTAARAIMAIWTRSTIFLRQVQAATGEWMATTQATHRPPSASENTVLPDRGDGVFRTARIVAARGTHEWGNGALVQTDQCDQDNLSDVRSREPFIGGFRSTRSRSVCTSISFRDEGMDRFAITMRSRAPNS